MWVVLNGNHRWEHLILRLLIARLMSIITVKSAWFIDLIKHRKFGSALIAKFRRSATLQLGLAAGALNLILRFINCRRAKRHIHQALLIVRSVENSLLRDLERICRHFKFKHFN